MKKLFKLFTACAIICLGVSSCIENNPDISDFPNPDVSFDYAIDGDYELEYFVGSKIVFTNTSALTGPATWNFGDGTEIESTADTISHRFQSYGKFMVTLTIDGKYSAKTITISDITPYINIEVADEVCEVNTTLVQLSVELPNPEGLEEDYKWIFPAGTLDETGNPVLESTEKNPTKIKFTGVGSQRVVLQTTLGGRRLDDGAVNVQVGYNSPAKTVYYAVKGGNIMAYKIINDLPAGFSNKPFDLGVKSGQHPLNILFCDSSLYVLDAGKQFTYVDDVDGNLGDGKISVISKDGKRVETMLSNIGGTAFNDAFYGYIDESSKILYFSDRNTGFAQISLSARNETMDATVVGRTKFPHYVSNDHLGYYGNGFVYGAMNACFTKVGDTWWWSKTYNGTGIFRFKDSDILATATGAGLTPAPSSGMVLPGLFVKSFTVDQTRGYVYFVVYDASVAGFYRVPIASIGTILNFADLTPYKIAILPPDSEGSTGEFVSVSQMVLDAEDGSVYFGFRTGDTSVMSSGLKRYNPATNKVENVITGVDIYGITINNTKSKLL